MVLEDSAGERLALVVADLGMLSPILHRGTAQRVLRETGIGADRLIISVTHTHSGPGNYYEALQYNSQITPLPGYDSAMVVFLVDGLASAVENAFRNMGPAVAAWGRKKVTGLTRNRSLEAYLQNPGARDRLAGIDDDRRPYEAVDDTMRMLRVDRCDAHWTNCKPKGAFTIFAVHGTGYPPVNDLVDGDVHALVERGLEREIEKANPDLGHAFRSQAFHLFANGTEGDVSPAFPEESRCAPHLRFRAGRRPSGPRTPEPPEKWRLAVSTRRECLDAARRSVDAIGDALAEKAEELFREIGQSGHLSGGLTLQRSFKTLSLKGPAAPALLCPEPRSGTANFGGAEDGRTRIYKWSVLGLIPTNIEEGGRAIDRNAQGCHGAKRIGLGAFQGLVVGEHGLPEVAQLTVARVGSVLLAAVPAEVTTEAGARMKRAIRERGPTAIEDAGIIGLANGYLQYITTAEEYGQQHYEGGSTLYGPNSAAVVTAELAELAEKLAMGTPTAEVAPITAYPGELRSYFPAPTRGPEPGRISRRIMSLICRGNRLVARWIDLYPGRFLPHEGQVLEVQRKAASGWSTAAWDDERGMEVRAVEGLGGRGHLWEVTWVPDSLPSGLYRVLLMQREGLPQHPLPGGDGPTVHCP
jgi:neutral ceramidase